MYNIFPVITFPVIVGNKFAQMKPRPYKFLMFFRQAFYSLISFATYLFASYTYKQSKAVGMGYRGRGWKVCSGRTCFSANTARPAGSTRRIACEVSVAHPEKVNSICRLRPHTLGPLFSVHPATVRGPGQAALINSLVLRLIFV